MTNIISSFSYGSLTQDQLDEVKESPTTIKPLANPQTTKDRLLELASWRAGQPSSAVHAYNLNHLLSHNPCSFKYLNDNALEALRQDLLLAHKNLCLRYQFCEIEGKHQGLNFVNIRQCEFLLTQLERAKNPELALRLRTRWLEKRAQLILEEEQLNLWNTGKVELSFKVVGFANSWRLYWVWAGLMIRQTLDSNEGFFIRANSAQTLGVAKYPKPLMDALSYGLYYIRGSIHLLFALKHTISFGFMSAEEKEMIDEMDMGVWSRIYEQLLERKYELLNDFLWATSNVLGAVKLIGGTPLGPYGDLLTEILLFMDYELVNLKFSEALEQKNQELSLYNNEISLLQEKIIGLQTETDTQNQIEILREQLNRLKLAKNECEQELSKKSIWYQSQKANLIYSFSLIVAFAILIFPWENILTALGYAAETAVPAAVTLGLAGAVLLFALSAVHNCYQSYLEVSQAREDYESALTKCQKILDESLNKSISPTEYIRFQDFKLQADYQKALVQYQFASFMRTTLMQLATPAVIYGAFTFASMGIGCAIFAAWVLIAMATHFTIEKYKPSTPNSFEPADDATIDVVGQEQLIKTELKNASSLMITLGIFASTDASCSVGRALNQTSMI